MRRAALASSTLVVALLGTAPAFGATYTVTRQSESAPGTICAPGGACGLREAVDAANQTADDDTITVAAGTYALTQGALEAGAGSGRLTIIGAGAGQVTISGNQTSRLLTLDTPAEVSGVTLSGGGVTTHGFLEPAEGGALRSSAALDLHDAVITDSIAVGTDVTDNALGGALWLGGPSSVTDVSIRHAHVASGGDNAYGGGIYVADAGHLSAIRLYVTDTSAFNPDGTGSMAAAGGGIHTESTTGMTLSDVHVSDTSVEAMKGVAFGGGIAVGAHAMGTNFLDKTHVTGSTALSDVTSAEGGGIASFGSKLSLSRTTVDDNLASGAPGMGETKGGGVFSQGDVDVRDSTIASNKVTGMLTFGGGVYALGTAALTNVTITANQAVLGDGGGVTLYGPTSLRGSIVAGNAHAASNECQITGALTLGDGNVLGTSCGAPGALGVSTDDPQLAPLADNGGATPTMLPLAGSPALDRYTGCTGLDQRDAARPQGSACDSGAVELEAPTLTPPPAAAAAAGAPLPVCRDLDVATDAQPVGVALDCSTMLWRWSIAEAPAHGTLSPIGPDGRLTYTPAADFRGDDRFTYTAGGSAGGSAPATVTIHVRGDDTPARTTPAPAKPAAGCTRTIRLDERGERIVRARVSLDGHGITPRHRGASWTATVALGERASTMTITARRADGTLVRRTRTLAC
jgi:hypothetical protein